MLNVTIHGLKMEKSAKNNIAQLPQRITLTFFEKIFHSFEKIFPKKVIIAYEANSAASLNCTFFQILAHCELYTSRL